MEQCAFPRCKNLSDYEYIGRDICEIHWGLLCEADSKTEKRLLKKIGLVRDSNGSVVQIRGNDEID